MVDDCFFEIRKENIKHKEFTFVAVGRMVPVKQFDVMIDAFSRLKNKENIKLIIVGDGILRNNLERQIESLGLQGREELVGLKKPEEVSDILYNSDCFVLSSHRDTFGIVLIEAMAKGLPVITTKCGGPEDLVTNEFGLIVPPDNPEKLATAMNYMVHHASDYDSDAIRQYCYDNFSQEKISDRIINVYNRVLCKY